MTQSVVLYSGKLNVCIIYINCWTSVDSITAHFTEGLPCTLAQDNGFYVQHSAYSLSKDRQYPWAGPVYEQLHRDRVMHLPKITVEEAASTEDAASWRR